MLAKELALEPAVGVVIMVGVVNMATDIRNAGVAHKAAHLAGVIKTSIDRLGSILCY